MQKTASRIPRGGRSRRPRITANRAGPTAVLFYDRRGRFILRARTSGIDESTLHCLTSARKALGLKPDVVIELLRPPGRHRRRAGRRARYLASIIRTEEIGQLVAISLRRLARID
ncbi:MAG: hypothetical protein J7M21_00730 [Planctomycetes bacterium]|nr:hypothetical protein [Planctomycetota bacterium]